MNIFIKIAEMTGVTKKVRKWMQGKKTYVVNLFQMFAGLGAILALSGQVIDLMYKTLTLSVGWIDGAAGVEATLESIKNVWANHPVLIAGFSAAFYSVTDACSKMASYAANRRDDKKRSAAYGPKLKQE